MQIQQNDERITLSQDLYVQDLLREFGMENCHWAATPMNPDTQIIIDENNPRYDDEFTKEAYQSGVESVQFLAFYTRPDLAQAAGFLTRFNTKPNRQCWLAYKHLLRYLSECPDLGIIFRCDQPLEPTAYSNADWAGKDPRCHSTTGFMIMMAGGPVSWQSVR